MRISATAGLAALVILGGAGAANAQLPGGLKMPGVPDVGKSSVGSVTGVLSYCVKNKYLGGTDANAVLGTLSGKPEVEESDDYKEGLTGVLDSGGKSISFDSLPKSTKKQACDLVLKHAKSFI